MKNLILILISFYGLTVNSQTMKYKDIYSLIKNGKTTEALPHLLTFLKEEPKHTNANYWAGKIYYEKAKTSNSAQQSDSSTMFFKQALASITILDVNLINASRFPDFTGSDATIVLENGKKWLQAKMDEKAAQENELRLMQAEINKAKVDSKGEVLVKVEFIDKSYNEELLGEGFSAKGVYKDVLLYYLNDKKEIVRHGKEVVYYPTGKIYLEQIFKHGRELESTDYFHKTGKISSKRINYPSGNVKITEGYLDNPHRKVSTKWFSEDGKVIKEE